MLRFVLPLILIIIPISLALLRISASNQQGNTFRYPKAFLYMGVLVDLMIAVAVYFGVKKDDFEGYWPLLVAVFVIFIMGIVLIAWRVNWKIELTDEEIIYRTIFRITHKYKYDDITKIDIKYVELNSTPEELCVYIEDKKVKITYMVGDIQLIHSIIVKNSRKHKHHCEETVFKNGVNVKDLSFKKQKKIVIKQPLLHICIFTAVVCAFIALVLWMIINQDDWEIVCGMLGLTLILCVFMLYLITWRIVLVYDESYFVYNSLFAKNKRIYYASCDSYCIKRNELRVRCNNRTFRIPVVSKYADALLYELKNQGVKKNNL